MTVRELLDRARTALTAGAIEDASLEAELLLRHALGVDRVQLYLSLDSGPGPGPAATLWQAVERRLKGEPSAYIIGHREFCGLDFYVDRSVLIPRPESELLVEKAMGLARNGTISSIADIGTGSGAIAVSLAMMLPAVKIYATDISASALKVAWLNCHHHGVADRVSLVQGDLLDALPWPVDLIIANLPYVREPELAQAGPGSFEPVLALDGGPDGLATIRRLLPGVSGKLRPGGGLLLEIGQGQGQAVLGRLRELFPAVQIEVTPDWGGIERVVSLRTFDMPGLAVVKSLGFCEGQQ